MKNRNLKHSDNWATPPQVYEVLNREFNFSFDPCPFNDGEIDPQRDGLKIEWGRRNYVNPPYSKELKEAFIRKGIEESKKGKLCVFLLPVSTSTKVFHELIRPNAKEIRFLKGRVKFMQKNEGGEFFTPKNGGMHDSMIVIFEGK